jgi:DNA-binding Lrp family transcriptional regulator
MAEESFDRASRGILRELQQDTRLSQQALAERVGLSPTPVWRRIRELEARGVIRRWVALLDREKLGLHAYVLANVSLERHVEGVVEASSGA